MKRDIYKKLMNLGSSGADELLVKKASEVKDRIASSSNNDEIYEQLEILSQFAYKVSDDVMDIAGYLLRKEPTPPAKYSTELGPYTGKDHEDVVAKILDLLDKIRYYQSEKILAIYRDLFIKGGRKKLLEGKIRNLLEYNLDAMQRIGYKPQLIGAKLLKEMEIRDDNAFEFFLEAARHLLSTEGEMHHMKDENTLVWGSAPLPFNSELGEVRESILEQINQLINSDISVDRKIRLIELAQTMTYLPNRGEPSNDLSNHIKENIKTVVGLYRDILFANGDDLKAPLPIALEIEESLMRLRRNEQDKTIIGEINAALSTLSQNNTYATYRTLLGDELHYIDRGESSFETVREEAQKDRDKLLETISETNWKEFYNLLNEAAESIEQIDDWKLNDYYGFLSNLAARKPQVALLILEEGFKNNEPLSKAATHFLIGFTNGNHIAERDKTLAGIKRNKIAFSFRLVCFSYTLKQHITPEDLASLEEIITHSGGFSFIKDISPVSYVDHLAMGLSCVLSKQRKDAERLFLMFLERYKQYAPHILNSIAVELHAGNVKVGDFSPNITKVLLKELVHVEDLSHMDQELLVKLAGGDARSLIELFKRRINHEESKPKSERPLGYEAIPSYLDDSLKDTIRTNSEYQQIFGELLDSFTPKWSKYNWEIASLIKSVGGYKESLLNYIRQADKERLGKALLFCEGGIESTDLDIVFALVARTSDKKKWSSIRNLIYTTGMVEGEYGLAQAHEAKRDLIRDKYLNSSNKRIREFATETVDLLEKWAADERRRTDEDRRLRKIEFER